MVKNVFQIATVILDFAYQDIAMEIKPIELNVINMMTVKA